MCVALDSLLLKLEQTFQQETIRRTDVRELLEETLEQFRNIPASLWCLPLTDFEEFQENLTYQSFTELARDELDNPQTELLRWLQYQTYEMAASLSPEDRARSFERLAVSGRDQGIDNLLSTMHNPEGVLRTFQD